MWKGYAGRNSAIRSWAVLEDLKESVQSTSATVACLKPEQWTVVHAVGSTAACRIQNFAEACPHVSPFVRTPLGRRA